MSKKFLPWRGDVTAPSAFSLAAHSSTSALSAGHHVSGNKRVLPFKHNPLAFAVASTTAIWSLMFGGWAVAADVGTTSANPYLARTPVTSTTPPAFSAVQNSNLLAAIRSLAKGESSSSPDVVKSAINAATNMDTWQVNTNVSTTGTVVSNKSGIIKTVSGGKLTFSGNNGNSKAINNTDSSLFVVDGSGSPVVFDGFHAPLSGINAVVTGGAVFNRGGSNQDSASTMYLNNVKFQNNSALGKNAGAVYNEGYMVIRNATFEYNQAKEGGAVEHFADQRVMRVLGSTFKNNTAIDAGGAMKAYDGNLFVESTTFTDNVAGGMGGAIYFKYNGIIGLTNTLTNVEFTGNKAQGSNALGGAVYMGKSNLNLTDTNFTNNFAAGKGGAVYVGAGTLTQTVTSGGVSQYFGNTANGNANSVYVDDGTYVVDTKANATLRMQDPLAGYGTIKKQGTGTWELAGLAKLDEKKTSFTVESGVLKLLDAGSANGASFEAGKLDLGTEGTFTLKTGATLWVEGNNLIKAKSLAFDRNSILKLDFSNTLSAGSPFLTLANEGGGISLGKLALVNFNTNAFNQVYNLIAYGVQELSAYFSINGIDAEFGKRSKTQEMMFGIHAVTSNSSKTLQLATLHANANGTVTWTGDNGGLWDEASTKNWKGRAIDTASGTEISVDTFLSGDKVIFDENATNKNITLSQGSSIEVADMSILGANYVFSGDATVTGKTTLNGNAFTWSSGTLTLGDTLDLSGTNAINGSGTVNFSNLSDIVMDMSGANANPRLVMAGTVTGLTGKDLYLKQFTGEVNKTWGLIEVTHGQALDINKLYRGDTTSNTQIAMGERNAQSGVMFGKETITRNGKDLLQLISADAATLTQVEWTGNTNESWGSENWSGEVAAGESGKGKIHVTTFLNGDTVRFSDAASSKNVNAGLATDAAKQVAGMIVAADGYRFQGNVTVSGTTDLQGKSLMWDSGTLKLGNTLKLTGANAITGSNHVVDFGSLTSFLMDMTNADDVARLSLAGTVANFANQNLVLTNFSEEANKTYTLLESGVDLKANVASVVKRDAQNNNTALLYRQRNAAGGVMFDLQSRASSSGAYLLQLITANADANSDDLVWSPTILPIWNDTSASWTGTVAAGQGGNGQIAVNTFLDGDSVRFSAATQGNLTVEGNHTVKNFTVEARHIFLSPGASTLTATGNARIANSQAVTLHGVTLDVKGTTTLDNTALKLEEKASLVLNGGLDLIGANTISGLNNPGSLNVTQLDHLTLAMSNIAANNTPFLAINDLTVTGTLGSSDVYLTDFVATGENSYVLITSNKENTVSNTGTIWLLNSSTGTTTSANSKRGAKGTYIYQLLASDQGKTLTLGTSDAGDNIEVVWTGEQDNIWNIGQTENWEGKVGKSDVFSDTVFLKDDDVVFNARGQKNKNIEIQVADVNDAQVGSMQVAADGYHITGDLKVNGVFSISDKGNALAYTHTGNLSVKHALLDSATLTLGDQKTFSVNDTLMLVGHNSITGQDITLDFSSLNNLVMSLDGVSTSQALLTLNTSKLMGDISGKIAVSDLGTINQEGEYLLIKTKEQDYFNKSLDLKVSANNTITTHVNERGNGLIYGLLADNNYQDLTLKAVDAGKYSQNLTWVGDTTNNVWDNSHLWAGEVEDVRVTSYLSATDTSNGDDVFFGSSGVNKVVTLTDAAPLHVKSMTVEDTYAFEGVSNTSQLFVNDLLHLKSDTSFDKVTVNAKDLMLAATLELKSKAITIANATTLDNSTILLNDSASQLVFGTSLELSGVNNLTGTGQVSFANLQDIHFDITNKSIANLSVSGAVPSSSIDNKKLHFKTSELATLDSRSYQLIDLDSQNIGFGNTLWLNDGQTQTQYTTALRGDASGKMFALKTEDSKQLLLQVADADQYSNDLTWNGTTNGDWASDNARTNWSGTVDGMAVTTFLNGDGQDGDQVFFGVASLKDVHVRDTGGVRVKDMEISHGSYSFTGNTINVDGVLTLKSSVSPTFNNVVTVGQLHTFGSNVVSGSGTLAFDDVVMDMDGAVSHVPRLTLNNDVTLASLTLEQLATMPGDATLPLMQTTNGNTIDSSATSLKLLDAQGNDMVATMGRGKGGFLYGLTTNNDLSQLSLAVANDMGYTEVFWNGKTDNDWDGNNWSGNLNGVSVETFLNGNSQDGDRVRFNVDTEKKLNHNVVLSSSVNTKDIRILGSYNFAGSGKIHAQDGIEIGDGAQPIQVAFANSLDSTTLNIVDASVEHKNVTTEVLALMNAKLNGATGKTLSVDNGLALYGANEILGDGSFDFNGTIMIVLDDAITAPYLKVADTVDVVQDIAGGEVRLSDVPTSLAAGNMLDLIDLSGNGKIAHDILSDGQGSVKVARGTLFLNKDSNPYEAERGTGKTMYRLNVNDDASKLQLKAVDGGINTRVIWQGNTDAAWDSTTKNWDGTVDLINVKTFLDKDDVVFNSGGNEKNLTVNNDISVGHFFISDNYQFNSGNAQSPLIQVDNGLSINNGTTMTLNNLLMQVDGTLSVAGVNNAITGTGTLDLSGLSALVIDLTGSSNGATSLTIDNPLTATLSNFKVQLNNRANLNLNANDTLVLANLTDVNSLVDVSLLSLYLDSDTASYTPVRGHGLMYGLTKDKTSKLLILKAFDEDASAKLTWVGDQESGKWNINDVENWDGSIEDVVKATKFRNHDEVIFDHTAHSKVVNIAENVVTGDMIINAANANDADKVFQFSGSSLSANNLVLGDDAQAKFTNVVNLAYDPNQQDTGNLIMGKNSQLTIDNASANSSFGGLSIGEYATLSITADQVTANRALSVEEGGTFTFVGSQLSILDGVDLEKNAKFTLAENANLKTGGLNIGSGARLTLTNGTLTSSGDMYLQSGAHLALKGQLQAASHQLVLATNAVLDLTVGGGQNAAPVVEVNKLILQNGKDTLLNKDISGLLNIYGYKAASMDQAKWDSTHFYTAIKTNSEIDGFDSQFVSVADQPTQDFLTVVAQLDSTRQNLLLRNSLTWLSTEPTRKSHGDFTVDKKFELDVPLEDITDPNDKQNWRSDWDGKSLTKKGDGTLILLGNNQYTGETKVLAGTLQIGNGGVTGALTSDVSVDSNATLEFQRNDYEFANTVSGLGTLVQNGSGKLILTADSGNLANVEVKGGSLQFGNGGANGGIASTNVKLSNANNDLIFSHDSDYVFSGTITGAGGVVKTGTDTLVLSENHSYQGRTLVKDGNLQIGNGSNNGHISSNIVFDNNQNSKAVVFNRNTDDTYAGEISGNGDLIKDGSNTLTLTGSNSWQGKTIIKDGTLRIGDGHGVGSLGDLDFAQNNNTKTVVFNRYAANEVGVAAYNGSVTGEGKIVKEGGGTLQLLSDISATFTGTLGIVSGKVEVGGGSVNGWYDADTTIAAGAELVFNRNEASITAAKSFTKTIEGQGSLTKKGTGILYLDADNRYSGGTVIREGVLVARADRASLGTGEVTVYADARLAVIGNGTFDNVIRDQTPKGKQAGYFDINKKADGDKLTITADSSNFTGTTVVRNESAAVLTGKLGGKVEVREKAYFGLSDLATIAGTLESVSVVELLATSQNVYNVGGLTLLRDAHLTTHATGVSTIDAGTGTMAFAKGSVLDFVKDASYAFNAQTINGFANAALNLNNAKPTSEGSVVLVDLGAAGRVAGGNELRFDGVKDNSGRSTTAGDLMYGLTTDANKQYVTLVTVDATKNTGVNNRLTWTGSVDNVWDINTTGNWQGNIDGKDVHTFLENDHIIFANDGLPGNSFVEINVVATDQHTFTTSQGQQTQKGIKVGSMVVDDNYRFTGDTLIVAGGVTANSSLGLQAGDRVALVADTVDLDNHVLDIAGYTASDDRTIGQSSDLPDNLKLMISTQNGIKDYNGIVRIDGQSSTDFMSARAQLSQDNKELWVESNLRWYSNNLNSKAHGNFTVNGRFVLNTVLKDHSGNLDSSWDGKTLTKRGEGILVLAENNTYTGKTLIDEGILQIGNKGSTGNVAGNIEFIDNGKIKALVFEHTADVAFDQLIVGAGDVTVKGDHTLTFSKDQTFTGRTVIGAGKTLQLGNGSALSGWLAGEVVNFGTLVFNRNDALTVENKTFAQSIIGDGAIVKDGNGWLTLTHADNVYSGGVTVNNGRLTLAGNSGATLGDLTINNGELFLDLTADLQHTEAINGKGNLHKVDDKTLTLAGDTSAYSGTIYVENGIAQLANTADFAANVDVAENASWVFARTGGFNYSGILSGKGDVAIDSGIVDLKGKNTLSGTATVGDGARLLVSGSLAGSVAVEENASFVLSGSVGNDVTIASDATMIVDNTSATTVGNALYVAGALMMQDKASTALTDFTLDSGAMLNIVGNNALTASGKLNFAADSILKFDAAQTGTRLTLSGALDGTLGAGQVMLSNVDKLDDSAIGLHVLVDAAQGSGHIAASATLYSDASGSMGRYKAQRSTDANKVLLGLTTGQDAITGNEQLQLAVIDAGSNTTMQWQPGNGDQWNTVDANWSGKVDNIVDVDTFLNGDDVVFGKDTHSGNHSVVVDQNGVQVATMHVKDNYSFTGGTIYAHGAVTVDADATLGLRVGDTWSLHSDKTVDFNNSMFNISGYYAHSLADLDTDAKQQLPVHRFKVISSKEGVLNFNELVKIGNQSVTDFMSASAMLDNNEVWVETRLAWNSNEVDAKAHGNFTLDADNTFTLAVPLTDTTKNLSQDAQHGVDGINGWNGTTLTKLGEGTLVLAADNRYTGKTYVKGGALQLGEGGTEGSVAGDIALDNATLVFYRSNDMIVNRVIEGNGLLVKKGEGMLSLAGNNTFSGHTDLLEGSLKLSGQLAGDLSMAAGTLFEIAASGHYTGDVSATQAQMAVKGLLTGNIKANASQLELGNVVDGDVEVNNASTVMLTGDVRGALQVAEQSTLDTQSGAHIGKGLTVAGSTWNLFDKARADGDLRLADSTLNLYRSAAAAVGSPFLTVDGDAGIVNTQINIGLTGDEPVLNAGTTLVLFETTGQLDAYTGLSDGNTLKGYHGVSVVYDFDVMSQGKQLLATLTSGQINPQTKSFSEGRLAGMVGLLSGADLVANKAILEAQNATHSRKGIEVFGVGGYSDMRYQTGSHIDVKGYNALTGLAASGEHVLVGAFFEYGNGNYDTYNSFANAASVHGDGKTDYVGGGLLARVDFGDFDASRAYSELTLRGGQASTDFKSNDLRDLSGKTASFTVKTPYMGASLALGYLWNASATTQLDLYSKLLWTRQNSDAVTVSTGEKLAFDAVDSQRVRAGFKLNHGFSSALSGYLGSAYEYEFAGKAKATSGGYAIEAPELNGGSAMVELGLNIKANDKLTFDVGAQGYSGKREGVSGSLRMSYKF